MIAYDKELYYWKSNKEWYGIDKNGKFYIKENAPDKAKKSFEKWRNVNID